MRSPFETDDFYINRLEGKVSELEYTIERLKEENRELKEIIREIAELLDDEEYREAQRRLMGWLE